MSPELKWSGNTRKDFEKLVPPKFLDDLERGNKIVREEDNDVCIVIEGAERIGKSTLALIICLFVDHLFSIDSIVFFKRLFVKALRKLKKYQALQYDEAGLGLYKRDGTTKGTKIINKILMTVGQRNLWLVFLIPSFAELDKYLRTHRIDTLIRVTEKGYAKVYSKKKIKQIRQNKDGSLIYPMCEYAFHFKKLEGEVWNEYKKHKKEQLDTYLKDIDDKDKTESGLNDFQMVIEWSRRNPKVSPIHFIKANPGIRQQYIYNIRNKNKELWHPDYINKDK